MKKNFQSGRSKYLVLMCFLNLMTCHQAIKKQVRVSDFSALFLVDWNELILKTAEAEDGFLTLKGVRTAAMMHLAMHDALNIIIPHYSNYAESIKKPTANPELAAAHAAFEIAVSQYPDQQEVFVKLLKKNQGEVEDSEIKQAAAIGKHAAQVILDLRVNDAWNTEAQYQWHPMAPGVYAEFNEHSGTPEGFVFGAGWAKSKPFVLPKEDFFRSPPPPAINSAAYSQAFNEVKDFGSHLSAQRSQDQGHLALWWKDFVENSHNRLARKLVKSENLDLWQSARLFALLNMSIFDAYVNVFENKFHYNHWRPYTAIRWAEHDGNSKTVADKKWNNLHQHTYAFPSYPSAHGAACSAAMTVLADVFGSNFAFTMTTSEVDKAGPFSGKINMQPVSRSFSSFADASLECSLSRIYLGIHFRYDSIEGNQLGKQIGDYVIQHVLRPF